MTAITRYILILLFVIAARYHSFGQCSADSVKNFKAPRQRQLWHDDIDKEQRNMLKWDGKDDGKLIVSNDDDINFYVTKAATTTIDCFQLKVEKDSSLNGQQKVGYLRWYMDLLKNIQKDWAVKSPAEKVLKSKPSALPVVLAAFERGLEAMRTDQSLLEIVKGLDYGTAGIIIKSSAFEKNKELKACKDEMVRKYCGMYPKKILATLQQNPDVTFADSLIEQNSGPGQPKRAV